MEWSNIWTSIGFALVVVLATALITAFLFWITLVLGGWFWIPVIVLVTVSCIAGTMYIGLNND